jgi:hypothetical protein
MRISYMSRKKYEFVLEPLRFLLKGLSLSAGIAILASNGAIATATPFPTLVADNSPSQDVQVDTEAQPSEPNQTQPNSESTSTQPSSESDSTTASQPRFACQFIGGQYTVMYHPKSQPSQAYPWAIPSNLGGGWTSERRCNEISRRLESYRPDGLQELRASVENNYNIVCVTTEKNSDCRIVLTVPPNQDSQSTRDRVFQNLTLADSGKETQGINTFINSSRDSRMLNDLLNLGLSSLGSRNRTQLRSQNVDLRPFLDKADGGNGTRLRNGVGSVIPPRANPRLNPNNFR